MGHLPFDAVPALMADATALMTGAGAVTTRGAAGLQPLRLRDPRGPVPDLRPAAGRGAGLPQRGARLLRLLAPRRRPGRLPRRRPLLQRLRRQPRPGRLRARRPPGHVVPRHGPAPAHPHALLVGKSFTPRRVAEMEDADPGAGRRPPRRRRSRRAPSTSSPTSPGKLPMDVISELVGVPPSDRAEVRRLADLLVHREEGVNDVPPEGIEAALTLAGYYADMVGDRRRHRRDDLTSVAARGRDRRRPAERRRDHLASSSSWWWPATRRRPSCWATPGTGAGAIPDQRAKPLADPARVPDWVEETLRYDTSTQMILRVTRQPVERAGRRHRRRAERVLLLIGSANRDEAVFADPDRYDLDRDTQDLISFGGGRHFCMGAALARLEARVALTEELAPGRGLRHRRRRACSGCTPSTCAASPRCRPR